MELLLVRHSITPGNLLKQYIGSTNQPLAPQGIKLAREAKCKMPAIDGLWVSPMTRCRQTAQLLFPEMEQHIVPGLRECDFGAFECKTWEQLKDDPLYRRWVDGEDVTPPGCESMRQCQQRTCHAIRQVMEEAWQMELNRAGVVAHGGTIMAVMFSFGLPVREFYGWQVKNCGGFLVKIKEDFKLEVLQEL